MKYFIFRWENVTANNLEFFTMMMTIATKKSNESQKMYEEAQKSRYFLVNMLKTYFRESVDYHTVTKLKYSKDVYLDLFIDLYNTQNDRDFLRFLIVGNFFREETTCYWVCNIFKECFRLYGYEIYFFELIDLVD